MDGLGRVDSFSGRVGETISRYECCTEISIFSPMSFLATTFLADGEDKRGREPIPCSSHKFACSFCLRFFLF